MNLVKDDMTDREERLNNLLNEGNETSSALQTEMESLKNQYERRLRTAEETRRENEANIVLLEKDIDDMRSRLLNADKTNERTRADIENKERELQREKHQNKIRETETNEKIDGLYHDLKTQQKANEAVTADVESQNTIDQTRLEKKNNELKEICKNQEVELETVTRHRDTLKQSDSDLKEELRIVSDQLETIRTEKNSLCVKLREQEVIDDELRCSEVNTANLKADRDQVFIRIFKIFCQISFPVVFILFFIII